ncbi:MAG: superoxide dismutase family protein [Betaproteobacteria bacterium]|nr:superoxide dismutase family protein [Betaproteobacteria bacterium]
MYPTKNLERRMLPKILCAAGFVALAVVSGAASADTAAASAVAQIEPTQGNKAKGVVEFTQEGDKMHIVIKLSGLTPGLHGFHIHEKGDCSAPDASSAGGHFNPSGVQHGDPMHGTHHLGDLSQLTANAAGEVQLEETLPGITLGTGPNNIVGRSLIVHAGPDDYKAQPAGNSGARVACGVIKAK